MSETPILDLDREPPEPSKPWLPKLIALFVGVVIGLILVLRDHAELPDWHWPAFNGLLMVPALYVSIAVHEVGHLIAGTLVGLDIGGIAIGGFVFLKSGKNWTFRFDGYSWTGGFFVPFTNARSFRRAPLSWMIAGGPMASLGLTLVCLLAHVHAGSGIWNSVGSLFWIALLTLIFSVIPFSSGLNRSDGARLSLLLRHPDQALSWMALLALQTGEAKGLRPREWDPELVRHALSFGAEAREYPYCQLMAYYRRLDEGAESAALQHLENALARSAKTGRPMRHVLYLEAASANANIRKQVTQARDWCRRACKLRKPKSLDAIEAGIAMCEGRFGEALQSWEAARAYVARRKLDSGLVRFAKEKWAEYESVCRIAVNE